MTHVIGTAGHVDHGKSTLVQALTGIDPDRLREEKQRGLTIDLGFAWLTLPSGREVSIVDVPGHERFIKNMLAGAGGIDLALLVIAADEGPMPQTREHLAILDLLDVTRGIVVITKTDMVEEEYVDLVEAEIEETLAGTSLAGAPRVRVSALQRTGLDDLLRTIDEAIEATPRKRDLGRPRLPIDRSFTIQGFGAVVTGTLVDGALDAGSEVEIQPGRIRARVRGLQRHRTKTARLEPGTRAAVNLSGVHAEDLERGMVLARPGALSTVFAVDVRIRATSLLSHAVGHDAGITFLSATAESEGKLRLLDRDSLAAGESAWAQIVLEREVVVSRGDHFIVRTPNETVGGGRIVALNPKRHRRNHAPTLDALELALAGSPADRLRDSLLAKPGTLKDLQKRMELEADVVGAAFEDLLEAGEARLIGERAVSLAWLESAIGRCVASATEYLAAHPLRPFAPREQVRSEAGLDGPTFELVVGEGVAGGRLDDLGAGLAPAGYEVTLPAKQQEQVDRYLAALRTGGFAPPTDAPIEAGLLALLVGRGSVVDAGNGVVFDSSAYAEMERLVVGHLEAKGQVTMAEVRDMLGSSRKYVQAFLESLDARKVTRRAGDVRTLR